MTHIREMWLQNLAAELCIQVGYRILSEPEATVKCKIPPDKLQGWVANELATLGAKPWMKFDLIHKVINGEMFFEVKRLPDA